MCWFGLEIIDADWDAYGDLIHDDFSTSVHFRSVAKLREFSSLYEVALCATYEPDMNDKVWRETRGN